MDSHFTHQAIKNYWLQKISQKPHCLIFLIGQIEEEKIESVNILDSYALLATSVEVPVKLPFIGRLTASPGYHYLKVAHRLKDSSDEAKEDGIDLYERAFFNYNLSV